MFKKRIDLPIKPCDQAKDPGQRKIEKYIGSANKWPLIIEIKKDERTVRLKKLDKIRIRINYSKKRVSFFAPLFFLKKKLQSG